MMSSDSVSISNLVKGFYDAAAQDKKNISLSRRKKSRIYYMRNLNNWIKGSLIARYIDLIFDRRHNSDVNVLDFCCGKGGDQKKWQVGRVDHVTFVDISSASIDICRERYETLRLRDDRRSLFSADFIVHDCTTPLKLDKLYSIVNCQFALHYAFESIEKARTILQNGSQALEDGGYFLITVPNAYELIRHLKQSKDKRSFGNSVYKITFDEPFADADKPPALFGARYHFHLEGVVDCPEYLVYPPLLVAMAEELGLECVQGPTPFSDFFKTVTSDSRSEGMDLLRTMDALESWFPPDQSLSRPDSSPHMRRDRNRSQIGSRDSSGVRRDRSRSPIQEYGGRSLVGGDEPGAYRYVEEKQDRLKQPVGTISLPEWEAFCTYCIFVFKKVVTSNVV
nr:mRNA cap guanine N7 methyltransferase [Hymenolepis microstoma]